MHSIGRCCRAGVVHLVVGKCRCSAFPRSRFWQYRIVGYVIPICTFHALAKEVFEHQEVHIRLPNLLLMYCSSQNLLIWECQ